MLGLEKKKTDFVLEMLEHMEALFTDLRLEYLEMAGKYDDALKAVEDLEADKLELEEQLDRVEMN